MVVVILALMTGAVRPIALAASVIVISGGKGTKAERDVDETLEGS